MIADPAADGIRDVSPDGAGRDLPEEFRFEEAALRMQTFFDLLMPENPPFLVELEERAVRENVPVIRRSTQGLLWFFLTLAKPQSILEIGSGIGFSALLMAEAAKKAQITTVEIDPARAEEARANFAGYAEKEGRRRIRLIEDDALAVMEALCAAGEQFDLLFMDAAKGQYLPLLPYAEKLVRPSGLMISDNILRDGEVLDSRYLVERRNRTIHRRMREYLETLARSPEWRTYFAGTQDGNAVSVRL